MVLHYEQQRGDLLILPSLLLIPLGGLAENSSACRESLFLILCCTLRKGGYRWSVYVRKPPSSALKRSTYIGPKGKEGRKIAVWRQLSSFTVGGGRSQREEMGCNDSCQTTTTCSAMASLRAPRPPCGRAGQKCLGGGRKSNPAF